MDRDEEENKTKDDDEAEVAVEKRSKLRITGRTAGTGLGA